MKIYLLSLGAGILVGVIYALLQVRSPAPPVIALIGLLGILIGEQVVPAARRLIAGESITAVWFQSECMPRITGTPSRLAADDKASEATESKPSEKS